MSEKPTTVRYSLSEIKAKRERGEDQTRADAPEAELLGEEFWQQARVVMSMLTGTRRKHQQEL